MSTAKKTKPARNVIGDKIERRYARRERSKARPVKLARGAHVAAGEWTPQRRRPDPTGGRGKRRRARCIDCHGTGVRVLLVTTRRGTERSPGVCGCSGAV